MKPKRRLLFACSTIALFYSLAIFLNCVPAAAASPQEAWLGVYFNGKKIGYSNFRIVDSTFHGKPAKRIESKSEIRIELLGNRVDQNVDTFSFTDTTYTPIYQSYRIESRGAVTAITADYKPGKIVCTLKSGGSTTTKEVTVPPGTRLIGDGSNATQGQHITLGTKEKFAFLNPLTLALETTEVEVQARQKVKLGNKPYEALRVFATTPFGPMTSWETADGSLLKSEMILGMVMLQETKEAAMNRESSMPVFEIVGAPVTAAGSYKPQDFAIATAVTVDKPIEKPRETRSLDVQVTGIDNPGLILSDSRQTGKPAGSAYDISVKAVPFAAAESILLPIQDRAMQPFLARAAYLEIDDPAIRQAAAKIKGTETNAYKVAVAIRKWIHSHMTPDYSIGVPRSCTDVLKRPRGVCRDYATLFTGLARAAGVPTRVVCGIVYAEGKFFYHAWAECWVGQWVAFDPTMDAEVVDATHIKFAQGDVTQMFAAASIIGRLKLSVVSVGTN